MLLAAFRAQYPEFQTAGDTYVQTFLDAAGLEIDASIWGKLTDQAQGLLAAHKMCIAPNGQMARLQTDKGKSTYGKQYVQMRYSVTSCIRVF